MKFNTLRTKFLAVLLPLFIGSFLVFFAISFYMCRNTLFEDADEIAEGVGSQAALQVEKKSQEKLLRLEELTHNPSIIQGDRNTRIYALMEAKQRAKGFDMLAFSDINGKAVSDKGLDMDRSSRDYINKVRETRAPYVTGPMTSGSSGKLITVMALPVVDRGDIVGIVYGTIDLDSISALAGSFKYMDTGHIFIADQEGTVIAYEQEPDDVGQLDLSRTESSKKIDERLVQGFQTAVENHQQVSTDYTTAAGEQARAVLTPIAVGPHTWIAVATAPVSEIGENAAALLKIMGAAGIAIILLVVFVVSFAVKRFSNPIRQLREDCEIINTGDLSHREEAGHADDEIGDLAKGFAKMRGTMRRLLQGIQKDADQIADSSAALTAASHQSAEAANNVTSSINEIAAGIVQQSQSVENLEQTSVQMAEHAVDVAQKADAISMVTKVTVDRVTEGRGSVAEVVTHMNKIHEGTDTVQNSIDELAKSSDEIKNVVGIISSIAGQTNLLALNAAIEAARAGEYGRGFAVVAEEVRKLAEESGNSSQQIAELVLKIQHDMERAVTASKEGNENVIQGMQSVKATDGAFESIVVSIQALAGGIEDVSKDIQGIAEGTQAMRDTMENIKSVSLKNAAESQTVSASTQEQSASMQEIASATQKLSELADKLKTEAAKFKV